jgi:membrane-bound metal-dependent hydrolase YbcI (DUF457 family)
MTVYEHAMVGVTGALAAGLQRRHGWQLIAWGGFAAILPDCDGLTLVLGAHLYAEGHRLWTHNLLVAGLLAATLSVAAYQTDALTKIQNRLARHWAVFSIRGSPTHTPTRRGAEMWLWLVVGVVAAYSHLLIDVAFSAGRNLPVWGVPLLWPFSSAACAYPLVPWGDIGATVIFVAAMFAMLRWPARIRAIAAGSLIAVVAYMIVRGIFA